MKKLFVLILLILVLGGAYWYSTQSKESIPVPKTETENTVPDTASSVDSPFKITMFGGIGVAQAEGESYLVDQSGLTLYFDTKDEGRKSTTKPICGIICEQTWLPYLYDGQSGGIASNSKDPLLSRLNLYTRSDGQKQYALGTKPLYRYVLDTKSGERKGASMSEWQVARP